jgi:hypothetical protein
MNYDEWMKSLVYSDDGINSILCIMGHLGNRSLTENELIGYGSSFGSTACLEWLVANNKIRVTKVSDKKDTWLYEKND